MGNNNLLAGVEHNGQVATLLLAVEYILLAIVCVPVRLNSTSVIFETLLLIF